MALIFSLSKLILLVRNSSASASHRKSLRYSCLGLFLWLLLDSNQQLVSLSGDRLRFDNEEQGRKVYFPERDDGISG
jgi:hypothetical protein